MSPYFYAGGRPVYVFENHAEAIISWGIFRQDQQEAAVLLTLDEHTDTLPAFLRFGGKDFDKHGDRARRDELASRRLGEIKYSDVRSLESAAKDLWNDEHICAACESGIISSAFVVARQSPGKEQRRPFLTYLPSLCYVGCDEGGHNQECLVRHCDLAIHDDHLEPLLMDCRGFTGILESDIPFILDIDLDYFRTWKSLEPTRVQYFSRLVSRADVISIAIEPEWSKSLWLDDDSNWQKSLARLTKLIKRVALSS